MGERVARAGWTGYRTDGIGTTGVVLVHEYWGLTPQIEALSDRYAAEGLLVVAPDLYGGRIARSAAVASAYRDGLDRAAALDALTAAARDLRAEGASKVALVGFSLGGGLALEAAALAGIDACACFYGLPVAFDAARLRGPVLLHFATRDPWCTPDRVDALEEAIRAAHKSIEVHRYEADHSFCNEARREVHDPASARLAFDRTVAFLRRLG